MRGRILSRVDQGAGRGDRGLQPEAWKSFRSKVSSRSKTIVSTLFWSVLTMVMSWVISIPFLHGVLSPPCRRETPAINEHSWSITAQRCDEVRLEPTRIRFSHIFHH